MTMKIKVRLVRSPIGYNHKQKATIRGLGLRRLHSERVLENTPSIRGMIEQVKHMLEVEVVH